MIKLSSHNMPIHNSSVKHLPFINMEDDNLCDLFSLDHEPDYID